MLLRFAGPRLAAGNDALVPVRLRRGGRTLGGTLSWDSPKTLAPFTPESPFAGLTPPADIGVRRQILAEPDGDLPGRTWASLADGTPIVTAEKRGQGLVVLFHVTADTTWSNLPLSGPVRRHAAPRGRRWPAPRRRPRARPRAADRRGARPAADARRVRRARHARPPRPPRWPADYADRANRRASAGLLRPADGGIAVNALRPDDRLTPLDTRRARRAPAPAPLAGAETLDLRPTPVHPGAAAARPRHPGGPVARRLPAPRPGLGGRLRGRPAALAAGGPARCSPRLPAAAAGAAEEPPANRPNGIESALVTRLAYVVTGDAGVDEASRAGLTGLTQMLAARTALEPGEPVGIDPARDELAFYPLIYWPIAPGRPQPAEAAIRRLDAFMKNGGTVIFDTRDALTARPAAPPTPEAAYLRKHAGDARQCRSWSRCRATTC